MANLKEQIAGLIDHSRLTIFSEGSAKIANRITNLKLKVECPECKGQKYAWGITDLSKKLCPCRTCQGTGYIEKSFIRAI